MIIDQASQEQLKRTSLYKPPNIRPQQHETARARTAVDTRPFTQTAWAPATCGELIQGFLNGTDFLVNCPINLSAFASATPNWTGRVTVATPGDFSKSLNSVHALMDQCGLLDRGYGVDLAFVSNIPRGKGLASSTAEVSAALQAVVKVFQMPISPSMLTVLSTTFDSTDGTGMPGITEINQLTGQVIASFPEPPPLRFLIIDTGGEVDSVRFDRIKAREHSRQHENSLGKALSLVRQGLRAGRTDLISAGATISARINNLLMPKPGFEEILKVVLESGAMGLNCAHTGTVLGVMYDPLTCDMGQVRANLSQVVMSSQFLGDYQLTGGSFE